MLNNTKRRGTRIPHTRAMPHSRVSAELLNTVCYIKFSFRHSQRRTYNITKPNASERDFYSTVTARHEAVCVLAIYNS